MKIGRDTYLAVMPCRWLVDSHVDGVQFCFDIVHLGRGASWLLCRCGQVIRFAPLLGGWAPVLLMDLGAESPGETSSAALPALADGVATVGTRAILGAEPTA